MKSISRFFLALVLCLLFVAGCDILGSDGGGDPPDDDKAVVFPDAAPDSPARKLSPV